MSVNDQLARITNSPPLVSSPSLCRFLRYIVEETLAGRASGIKEQVLGLEVFDRGQDFNPRLDPIVRVQARNLRSRIAKYYEGPGAGDPIRIELPKGTYIPVFHQVGPVPGQPAAASQSAPSWPQVGRAAATVAAPAAGFGFRDAGAAAAQSGGGKAADAAAFPGGVGDPGGDSGRDYGAVDFAHACGAAQSGCRPMRWRRTW